MGWPGSRPVTGEPGVLSYDRECVPVRIEAERVLDLRDDDGSARIEGRLDVDDRGRALPIGRAVHLQRADGTRALVVIVNDDGRFLAAGPVH